MTDSAQVSDAAEQLKIEVDLNATEQKIAQDLVRRWVTRRPGNKVTVTRYHTDRQCDALVSQENAYDDHGQKKVNEVVELTERESDLLGLRECAQCEQKRTGGPAVSTIAKFLREESDSDQYGPRLSEARATDIARQLVAVLGVNGFYISNKGR